MKRQLNVHFLAWLVIPLLVLAVGGYFLWSFQNRRSSRKLYDDAVASQAKEDLDRAEELLKRYLNYQPDDADALTRYGFLIERNARTMSARLGAVETLERALRLLVANTVAAEKNGNLEKVKEYTSQAARVRLVLGNLLLDVSQQFEDQAPRAQYYFEWLTSEDHSKEGAEPQNPEWVLKRGLAHARQKGTSPMDKKDHFTLAQEAFDQVLALEPSNVLAAVAKATSMRSHKYVDRTATEVAEQADALVDNLVKAYPTVDSHMGRLRYRITNGNRQGALDDAHAALALEPNDVPAMMATAILEFEERQNIEEARQLLRKAIELQPEKLDAYTTLIEFEKRVGRYDLAEQVARDGIRKVANDELNPVAELYWILATTLIDAREQDKAKVLISYMRSQSIVPVPLLAYLDGRILMLQDEWEKAAKLIDATLVQIVQIPRIASDAQLDLAACYQQLASLDPTKSEEYRARRNDSLSSAVRAYPGSNRARVALAQSQAENENEDRDTRLRKVEETLSKVSGSTTDILVLRIRLAASAEIRKPQAERNWASVDELLAKAAEIEPDSAGLLETWIEVDIARNTLKDAEKRLDALIKEYPDRVNPRLARALAAQQQGLQMQATNILDEAERALGARPEIFQARIGNRLRKGGAQAKQSLIELIPSLEKYADKRDELTEALATALGQVRADSEAVKLWEVLAQRHPNELRYQSSLFDIAFRQNDEAALEKIVKRIKEIEGGDSVFGLFAEAGLEVCRGQKGDQAAMGRARTRLVTLSEKRKDWARVDLLRAVIAEADKDPEDAIEQYKLSLSHGNRQIEVVRRLVQLLYERQRYAEADAEIRNLENQREISSGEIKRLATDIALVNRDTQRALEMAAEAIPSNSTNFQDYLWLGQVYVALGRPEQAEQQFEKAVSLSPTAPEAWIGLTAFHARNKDLAKAEATLERAMQAMPPEIGTITTAQGYEVLGRNDKADVLYRQALATNPNDVTAMRAAAMFWLRQERNEDAEQQLRRLLDPATKANPTIDVPWARRQLTLLLVNMGGEQHFTEAMNLIDANLASDPASAGDLMVKAMALTSHADLRPKAIETMHALEKVRPLEPSQDLLMCRLLEAENNWPEARDRLIKLATRYDDHADVLGALISSLLRQGETAEAGPWVDRLNRIDRDSARAAIFSAQYYRKLGENDKALKRIQEFVQAKPEQASFAVLMLDELGDEKSAEEIYKRMAKEGKTSEEKFALATFHGRHGRIGQALDECDALRTSLPPEQVILNAMSILAGDSTASQAEFERVEKWIDEVATQSSTKADPRMLRAALMAIRGDVAGARDLYSQVLKSRPNDFTTLNNLAWLLAITGTTEERSQALPLINRAIQIIGPIPALLDTRSMVYLSLQDLDKAENDLKVAIGSQPNPEYLYHLARVQFAKHNKAAAQRTLQKARDNGLTQQSLDPLERSAYPQVIAELQTP